MSGTVNARPVRVQLSRKRGWRMPPNTVKVTRPGKWGNPFKVGEPHPHPDDGGRPIRDTAEAVELFEIHCGIFGLLEQTGIDAPLELKGKNLACWCKTGPCHADVLLELANGLSDGKGER